MPRTIAAWVPDERTALETVARSAYLTVAYDTIAGEACSSGRVVRRSGPAIPSRPIYLVHRRPVGAHHRTEALAGAIRAIAHVR